MATTYCTVADVADYLRTAITATTSPNKTQVEKIINRKEGEFERRTGHAWRTKTSKDEVYDLPLSYIYGWGVPINLKHRNCLYFDPDQGDKIEIWQGSNSIWNNVVSNTGSWDFEPHLGKLYLRGYLFSILRQSRLRVTYRYGGEDYGGDTTIPDDIKDCIIKMTCLELMNTMFTMNEVPTGGMVDINSVKSDWKEDIEQCITNRKEVFVIP
jgi:hypothetical protein